VRVLGTRIDLELAELVGSERVLGEHSTNRFFDGTRRVLFEEFRILDGRESTGVARVAVGEFLSQLRTSQRDFFGVDDDDEVAHVHVLGKGRLVLTAEKNRRVRSETAEDNVRGIDDYPFPRDICGLG